MKTFRKTGVSTLINILGMSVAFAAAMILMVQVRWDATYDKNFEGHEQVFRMESNWIDKGLFSVIFSRPVIETIRTASPNIEAVGTMQALGEQICFREGEKESAIAIPSVLVDSSMFSVLPFEWVEGSARDFATKGTALMDETFAKKFFGTESAVGKILQTNERGSIRIIGVFKTPPRNFSLHYGLLENIGDQSLGDEEEWSYSAWVKLKDASQVQETENRIMDRLAALFGMQEQSQEDMKALKEGFRLVNLHDAHFNRDVKADVPSVNKAVTITLASIAIMLILIAIINFINFAFAEIPFRIKNINTRKVLGEDRSSLVCRQLAYAGIIALVAFALAVAMMVVVSRTSFASYVSGSLGLSDNIGILALMFGVALVSAVAAGIAPAMYSTSQPPALVLKGSYAMTAKGKAFRNMLVGLQFVLSFIFILMAMFVGIQTKYMIKKNMGFPQESILQVQCGAKAGLQVEAMESYLLQNPSIEEVTFSDALIVSDYKMAWGRVDDEGNQIYVEVLPVADNFIQFFDLQILEGRDFQKSDNQSENGCFIANESFLQHFQQYRVGSLMPGHVGKAEIIGKVKDFNSKSLQHPMEPLVLFNWGRTRWRPFMTMYARTVPGADFKEVSKYIQDAVCKFDPALEPDQVGVRHLDEWIESMYQSEQSLGELITIASFVALLIAIIGIIGLVFFETQFLRKEIAVRRVNGATVGSILEMINQKYLVMAATSFVVAAPFSYWLMTAWRKGFAYQAPVPVWIFIAAFLAVAIITLVTVTLQSWRSANANPVESLNNE